MFKLIHGFILFMILNHSPTKKCDGVSCGKAELNIVAGVIKTSDKTSVYLSVMPVLQTGISPELHQAVVYLSSYKFIERKNKINQINQTYIQIYIILWMN